MVQRIKLMRQRAAADQRGYLVRTDAEDFSRLGDFDQIGLARNHSLSSCHVMSLLVMRPHRF
ncbi:MAG: hypothetical protein DMF67_09715 [Acidobacteria bacterium]|nr:MAG: hypothetical protein DMF67_09715 [Acidobacteriota bacterium]